jgi:SPP1 gp7 family putative phage head morphogenesis protein
VIATAADQKRIRSLRSQLRKQAKSGETDARLKQELAQLLHRTGHVEGVGLDEEDQLPEQLAVVEPPPLTLSLDSILSTGTDALRAIIGAVQRKVRGLARRGLPPAEMHARLRTWLGRHEPLLSRVMSDSLLAAWVSGYHEVGSELPGEWDTSSAGGLLPPEPRNPIAASDESEPVVRFPAIEAATHDLLSRQVMTRRKFDRLTADAKRAAFTIAHVSTLDALEKARNATADAVSQGWTLREYAEAIDDAVGKSALSPSHIETVYRTNVMAAQTTGLMDVLNHPLVSDEFPYLLYSASHDSRTRKNHLAMETLGIQGTAVYRRDDPIWELFLVPWDYNCRCAVVPLSLEDAAARGIQEAIDWLRTGVPPTRKAWVPMPPFRPPVGWTRNRIEALV